VDEAVSYLKKFSRLIRNILDTSQQDTVPLQTEITTLESYLSLQKLRFSDKFDYNLEVGNEVDVEKVFIPPLLAQPFIENALEHGIRHKGEKGHIEMRFTRDDSGLLVEVQDDGVGRTASAEIESGKTDHHPPMATSITRERLEILGKKARRKVTLEITDLYDDSRKACGTQVNILIPL
jgi:LytS/YehU family sensor histidine kinase